MKLRLPGRSIDKPQTDELGFGSFAEVETLGAWTVESSARGVAESTVADTKEIAWGDGETSEDVLELQYEGGITEILGVSQVESRFGSAARAREGEPFAIPAFRPLAGPERDIKALLLKGARLLRPKLEGLKKDALREVFVRTIRVFEKKLVPAPGVHRIASPRVLAPGPLSQIEHLERPILVLVHGTASTDRKSVV